MTFLHMQNRQERNIATLVDGTKFIFAEGRFDSWCIYHVSANRRHAIRDSEIFSILEEYAASRERFKLYSDFVWIFEHVTHTLQDELIEQIKRISRDYMNPMQVEYILTFLYAGMVAEENKKFAKLKKFIKRLGVHQVLIEKHAAKMAASYSRGKAWQELQEECHARGFYNHPLAQFTA